MEDISRELEREIAKIKPAPLRLPKKTRVLIIDDLGEIRSGNFFKILISILLVTSIVGGGGSVVFYQLYTKANNQNIQLGGSLDILEKKVARLISEKEILMARLVVTGNTAELETLASAGKIGQDPPNKEKRSGMKNKKEEAELLAASLSPDAGKNKDTPVGSEDRKLVKKGGDEPVEQSPGEQHSVSVESFSLSSGSNAQDVVIRFNIRNTTQNAKEISGRIFCVLKPKGTASDKWVVIPKASIIEGGIPGPYKRGHYFSISRFKPVQFTISTQTPLQDFTGASVFIFDETEKLVFKTAIDTGTNKQD